MDVLGQFKDVKLHKTEEGAPPKPVISNFPSKTPDQFDLSKTYPGKVCGCKFWVRQCCLDLAVLEDRGFYRGRTTPLCNRPPWIYCRRVRKKSRGPNGCHISCRGGVLRFVQRAFSWWKFQPLGCSSNLALKVRFASTFSSKITAKFQERRVLTVRQRRSRHSNLAL